MDISNICYTAGRYRHDTRSQSVKAIYKIDGICYRDDPQNSYYSCEHTFQISQAVAYKASEIYYPHAGKTHYQCSSYLSCQFHNRLHVFDIVDQTDDKHQSPARQNTIKFHVIHAHVITESQMYSGQIRYRDTRKNTDTPDSGDRLAVDPPFIFRHIHCVRFFCNQNRQRSYYQCNKERR